MAVTLQQIADMAGVSRGTVDRALNNRGRIRPEVEQKIKKIAKELGYQPSRAGRALAMAKKNLKIGVILQSARTPFMQEVLKGLEAAKKEVESLGTTVDIRQIERRSGCGDNGADAQRGSERYRLIAVGRQLFKADNQQIHSRIPYPDCNVQFRCGRDGQIVFCRTGYEKKRADGGRSYG